MAYTFAQYRQSADYIQEKIGGFIPKVAMVLGSGLGFLGDVVENPSPFPMATFPTSRRPPPPATRDGWCSATWRAGRWP